MGWVDAVGSLEKLVEVHEALERQAAHKAAVNQDASKIADEALQEATFALRDAEGEWLSRIQQPTLGVTLAQSWASLVHNRALELANALENKTAKDRETLAAFRAWQLSDAKLSQARLILKRTHRLRLKAHEATVLQASEDRLSWATFGA